MSDFKTLDQIVELVETNFSELGLTLTKVDNQLEWLWHIGTEHKATFRAVFQYGYRLAYQLDVNYVDENGDGYGNTWGLYDDISPALIRFIKETSIIKLGVKA